MHAFFTDPKDSPLADISFLVEDFEPERLAFEVSAPDGPAVPDEILPVDVAAKYLYGATAPDLDIEADVILRPRTTLAGYSGYVFGREDDTIQSDQIPLGIVGTTDASGKCHRRGERARAAADNAASGCTDHHAPDRQQWPPRSRAA